MHQGRDKACWSSLCASKKTSWSSPLLWSSHNSTYSDSYMKVEVLGQEKKKIPHWHRLFTCNKTTRSSTLPWSPFKVFSAIQGGPDCKMHLCITVEHKYLIPIGHRVLKNHVRGSVAPQGRVVCPKSGFCALRMGGELHNPWISETTPWLASKHHKT